MRRRALLPALLALAALAGGALAQLDVAATGDQRVSNLRLPLQRHPNGRVKELFLAKEGEMTPDGRFVVDGGILVLLCILMTFIGGLIPSQKAAKKDPVTALRTE